MNKNILNKISSLFSKEISKKNIHSKLYNIKLTKELGDKIENYKEPSLKISQAEYLFNTVLLYKWIDSKEKIILSEEENYLFDLYIDYFNEFDINFIIKMKSNLYKYKKIITSEEEKLKKALDILSNNFNKEDLKKYLMSLQMKPYDIFSIYLLFNILNEIIDLPITERKNILEKMFNFNVDTYVDYLNLFKKISPTKSTKIIIKKVKTPKKYIAQ